MQGSHWWLVCYDVHDPERLRKTAKHMEGYGERMQYSVFRCWVTRREVERVRWETEEVEGPRGRVCYDVHDPERLRKTAKHMEGYGERMQYSVFRCWLTRRELERLRWELTELQAPEDEVLLIPLCGSCVSGILSTHGAASPPN